MNYYPYYVNVPFNNFTPVAHGGLKSLLGGIKWSSIFNGTQKTLGIVNQAIPIIKQAKPVINNVKTMFRIMNEFKKAFEKYDILLTPTSPTVAFDIGSKSNNPLEMYLADICTVSVNIAGLPAISIPCGKDAEGMPIGMQLIGKRFDEQAILNAAYTFEQFGQ